METIWENATIKERCKILRSFKDFTGSELNYLSLRNYEGVKHIIGG